MQEKIFYTALDISTMLGISKASAYSIIKRLNKELEEKGYIVLQGKVSKAYFSEKWYELNKEQELREAYDSSIYNSSFWRKKDE